VNSRNMKIGHVDRKTTNKLNRRLVRKNTEALKLLKHAKNTSVLNQFCTGYESDDIDNYTEPIYI